MTSLDDIIARLETLEGQVAEIHRICGGLGCAIGAIANAAGLTEEEVRFLLTDGSIEMRLKQDAALRARQHDTP